MVDICFIIFVELGFCYFDSNNNYEYLPDFRFAASAAGFVNSSR
jgi:hypothetical protein